MSGDIIVCTEVVVQRGAFSLRVPSWSVPRGCVVGVVGPNGAGKTTLLELIPGLRTPTAGSIHVTGLSPVHHQVAVRSKVGFMSADMPVFDLRIDKLLRLLSGYYPTWDPELVNTLLERFQLDASKRARDLSRGQATRLRLVAALGFKPELLVLDEPTAGLDLGGRHSLLETILEVVRGEDRSVVISSHQLQDIARVADRLLVLDEGKVVQSGPTDELVGDERTLEEAVQAWGAAG